MLGCGTADIIPTAGGGDPSTLAGLVRLSTSFDWIGFEDVDAGNKCGHDESEIVAVGISHWRLAVKANLAPQTASVSLSMGCLLRRVSLGRARLSVTESRRTLSVLARPCLDRRERQGFLRRHRDLQPFDFALFSAFQAVRSFGSQPLSDTFSKRCRCLETSDP